MSTNDPTVACKYHEVSLDNHGDVDKENVHLTFVGVWRGQPAKVEMIARRYLSSSGITEWQVYCEAARAGAVEEYGASLTDTARTRLSEQYRPIVRTWLESDEYVSSRQGAFTSCLRGNLSDLRPFRSSTERVRKAIARHSAELAWETRDALLATTDAYDRFVEALEGLK